MKKSANQLEKYYNIFSGVVAVLKDKIKKEQFAKNEEKIRSHIYGLSFDIEHLSVYAPYCNAIFTDRAMAQYLLDYEKHKLSIPLPKIFSTEHWDSFDAYLDEIENSITPEIEKELQFVYEF